jgi:hypothetical protein
MARTRNNPPAPLIAPEGVLRLVVMMVTGGEVQENLYDFKSTSGTFSIPADQIGLATYFNGTLLPLYRACLTAATEITQVLIQDIVPGFNPTFIQVIAEPGTVGGNALPIEMQATIRKRSGLKGQHGYGRVMLPAVPVAFTTPAANPNILTNVALYQALATGIITGFAASGTYLPCITTRVVQPTPPLPPISPIPTRAVTVTSMPVDTLLGTQLRRRPGRGI